MSALDVLRAARERLATPERWTKHAYALDATQRVVVSDDPAAVCWCLSGALGTDVEICPDDFDMAAMLVSRQIEGFSTTSQWNDAPHRTHDEVLALLDEAIAIAETQEKEPA